MRMLEIRDECQNNSAGGNKSATISDCIDSGESSTESTSDSTAIPSEWCSFIEKIAENYNVPIEPSVPQQESSDPLYAVAVIDSFGLDGSEVRGWIASSKALNADTTVYLGAHGLVLSSCTSRADRVDVRSHFDHEHIASFRFVLEADEVISDPEHPTKLLNGCVSFPLFISFAGEIIEGHCVNNTGLDNFADRFYAQRRLDSLIHKPITDVGKLHSNRVSVIEENIDIDHYSKEAGFHFESISAAARHYYVWGEQDGLTPTKWFNPAVYRSSYIGSVCSSSVFYHYLFNGRKKGIRHINHPLTLERSKASIRGLTESLFDSKYYRSQIKSDVPMCSAELLDHYLENSIEEGTDPCSGFSTNYYLSNNPEIYNTDLHPFEHYATLGQYQFKRPHAKWIAHDLKFDHDPRKLRKTLTLPADAEFQENEIRHPKLGIHVHAHFVEEFQIVLDCLGNVGTIHTLHVTTNSNSKKEQLLEMINRWDQEDCIVNVEIVENRGRDVLPMIDWLKESSENFDLVLHLHTKRSTHLGDKGGVWFRNCLNGLIGSRSSCRSLFAYFDEFEDLGVAYPAPVDISSEWIAWGPNFPLAQNLIHKLEIDASVLNDELDFPAGTMFWFRPDALSDLFNGKITKEDFPKEPIGLDGTIAHAIERCVQYLAANAGYEVIKTKVLPYSMVANYELAQPSVSVVMPINNADDYLNLAIESVIHQGCMFPSIELILVNCDSNDQSRKIAKHYARCYRNIKFIDEGSHDLLHARSLGVEKAKGTYTYFFDAVDLLPANTLENLYSIACTTDADLVCSVYRDFDRDLIGEEKPPRPNTMSPHDISLINVKQYCVPSNNYEINSHEKEILEIVFANLSHRGKLFDTEYLKRNFATDDSNCIYEGNVFEYSGYLNCEKLVFTDEVTYFRRNIETNNITSVDHEIGSSQQLLYRAEALSNEYLKSMVRRAEVERLRCSLDVFDDQFDLEPSMSTNISLDWAA